MAEKKSIKITLKRSLIGAAPNQRGTVKALGLRKVNHTVEREDTPQVRGMINRVSHMLQVEE